MSSSGLLDGRRVLVIGASAGIGRAIAVEALAQGGEVAVVGRRQDRLVEIVDDNERAIVADLAVPEDCERLVDEAVKTLGSIDLLVFAAAASALARLRDADVTMWREVLATNLVAPALVTAAALPHLTSEGFVAFLSSEGVGAPYPGLVPYTTSKAGLEELVRGLRAEEPDVRFACVKVGTTDGTEFARSFDPELAAELFPTWVALGKIPARMMQPEELGGAILRTLAVALTHPGVDCQDLTFRAPGGPHLGGIEQLLASVAAAAGS